MRDGNSCDAVEHLEGGASLDDFLEWFPGVAREQALAVLAHAANSLAVA